MATSTVAPAQVKKKRSLLFKGLTVVLLLLLPAAIALGWFYSIARAALPQVDGQVHLAGISAPIWVLRDALGVPHIRAQNMRDLLFAQGYVTAQDRLWQLDITRRYAGGEMAEILGPSMVPHDRQQRILSLRQVAEKSVANLSQDELALLDAYVNGVNAFIKSHRDRLPLEFRILGYAPRPWTRADSFLVGANMAQELSHETFAHKLAREKITARLGAELASDLYPNRSWRDRPPGSLAEPQPAHATEDPDDPDDDPGNSVARAIRSSPGIPGKELRPGSNNWVVSGEHTVTGKPLLSNDMHLGHQIPNVWYEVQLSSGAFDVAGFSLPGLPFVIVGHNRRIAWGFTNLGPGVEDIFIETFNASGEYQTPQGWKRPEVRHEVIHIKNRPDLRMDVLSTRHGPVVSSLVHGETRRLALQWTIYTLGMGMPFGELDAAQNWEEFRSAFKRFTAPGQNAVYGDIDGHIGYQATGFVPRRRNGDGSLPVAGNDDAHEWTGYIPFEQLPSIYDPASGILASANGRITPDRYPFAVSDEWGTPYRTERIYQVLESGRKFSPADMLTLQTDIYSAFDQLCAEKLVQAIDHEAHASTRVREAAELLRAWDGRMTKESAAATIEILTRRQLMQMVLEPKLGALWEQYSWYNSNTAVENLLTRQPKVWLPTKYADYNQLLTAAVEAVVSGPQVPPDLASWHRGKRFPLEIQHPVFGQIPLLREWSGPGTVEQSGGSETVKQVGRTFGPSERMTVDFANLDATTMNIVTGESGELLSPHYMDEWHAWYEGSTFTFPFSSAAVEASAQHRLELLPE